MKEEEDLYWWTSWFSKLSFLAQGLKRLRGKQLYLLWKQLLELIQPGLTAKYYIQWEHSLAQEMEHGLQAWHCTFVASAAPAGWR